MCSRNNFRDLFLCEHRYPHWMEMGRQAHKILEVPESISPVTWSKSTALLQLYILTQKHFHGFDND